MTKPQLTDQELAELQPLFRVIAATLKANTIRLGDRDSLGELAGALTVKVSAYMGRLVGDVPEQLARAGAAGYRQAADNAAELRRLHGSDADAEMLVFSLQRGAELREQAAADPRMRAAMAKRATAEG